MRLCLPSDTKLCARSSTCRRSFGVALAAGVCAIALLPAVASANSAWWGISSSGVPTHLAPGGTGAVVLTVNNIGDANVELESTPVTIVDKLPANLTATSAIGQTTSDRQPFTCTVLAPHEVECVANAALRLPPFRSLEVTISVEVAAATVEHVTNEVTVSGGGAPPTTHANMLVTSAIPTPFGIENFEMTPEEEGGALDEQAGSHPFQLRTTLTFNDIVEHGHYCEAGCGELRRVPPELPRTVDVKLPPGLVGNPTSLPQCTDQQFGELGLQDINYCPADTAVGVVTASLDDPFPIGMIRTSVPLFNLVPRPGEPARFGFVAEGGVPVVLDTSLRTGEDYGVTVSTGNLSEAAGIVSTEVTFWGVPADSRHNPSRGWNCIEGGHYEQGPCEEPPAAHPRSFLSLPTVCGTGLAATASIGSWSLPRSSDRAAYTLMGEHQNALGLSGCASVPFAPTLGAAPDTEASASAAGLTLNVHVPQETSESGTSASEAQIKDATVTLPQGLIVNSAAAGGLTACTPEQIGLQRPGLGSCPDSAKIGSVEIHTPLLPSVVGGDVYLAQQGANPFGSLLAMYIVADDPAAGVVVKIPVRVAADSATGQLSAIVTDAPQLPFEDLTVRLFGGPRGVLITPAACGTYSTAATFAPWSGTAPVNAGSEFAIRLGNAGSECLSPAPFTPAFTAGAASNQAGAFAPLTTSVSRGDSSQALRKVQLRLPAGLLGSLATVARCQEPQASEGTCSAASLIGHVAAQVGAGSEPYAVAPGAVHITGPYEGAPFGLSIAEPAKAGPFDIGSGPCDCVVIRARIDVNPTSAALTVTTDPLPQILQGIPLSVRNVSVAVDRPGFTFNPTDCKATSIAATLEGGAGAVTQAAVPFQVANCAKLRFAPRFTALTSAHTSKLGGAYLHVHVAAAHGEANIAKVKVDLPLQLPSRLTTLQKACVDSVFAASPGGCPAESIVGEATAVTPVLAQPLRGRAYLVSHKAAQFPDLVIVLQGEGVTLDLVGATVIKHGITSSIFRSVPDAPIRSFDLVLPQGPHSVLTAFGSLCAKSLSMPTEITGQNGAVTRQSTRIAVSGCRAKHRPAKARKHKRH